jgi:sugar phosphate isomerase/epimerase
MRTAVCNEMFGAIPFPEQCALTVRNGFQGIELAPYTFADDPTSISPTWAREIRRMIEEAGLTCAGLHWLLKAPPGLHLTTPDAAIRRRSWHVLSCLLDFCFSVGAPVMVLGSGRQRNAIGIPTAEAVRHLREGLAGLASRAGAAGVRLLLEPLRSRVTDVVNTLDDARAVIAAVGNPAVSSIFDFHNTTDEREPWDRLVERHFDLVGHVHLNEVDGHHPSLGRRPGRARSEFGPFFNAIRRLGYAGWISLEIFHADDPPEVVLAETRAFLDCMTSITQDDVSGTQGVSSQGRS